MRLSLQGLTRVNVPRWLAASLVAIASLLIGGGAFAQDARSFYEGKSIKWIVPYKPGGGYDEYSRMLAPFVSKYTGARVDIVNMPGSGGMRGSAEIFKAPADGLTVGIVPGSALVMNEIAGQKGAAYKIAEFTYIGRISTEQRVMVVGAESGITNFEEFADGKKTIVVGAAGLGGNAYVDAVIAAHVFGLDQKLIHGFNNSPDIRLALLRGDIDAWWGSLAEALKGVSDKELTIVLHAEKNPDPELENIPSVYDAIAGSEDEAAKVKVLDAWKALSVVGRPVVGPPGIPEDRAAFLQDAFRKAMSDPELVETTQAAGRQISYASSDEMIEIIRSVTDMDQQTQELFAAAIRGEL